MRKSDLEDFLRSMAHIASVLNPQPTVAAVHSTLTLPLSPPKSSTACTLPFLADDIYTPHPSSLQTLSCPSSSVKPLRPFNLFSCSTNTYRGGDGDGPNDSASKGISTARRSLEEGLTAGSSNLAASSPSIPESGLIKVIEQRAAQIEKDVSRFFDSYCSLNYRLLQICMS